MVNRRSISLLRLRGAQARIVIPHAAYARINGVRCHFLGGKGTRCSNTESSGRHYRPLLLPVLPVA